MYEAFCRWDDGLFLQRRRDAMLSGGGRNAMIFYIRFPRVIIRSKSEIEVYSSHLHFQFEEVSSVIQPEVMPL